MEYVAYFRVSTQRQGASGLGLEAQEKAVGDFMRHRGATLLCSFTEIESGKRSDRPQLAKALAVAKAAGATLLIAKLDRLARNVAFISNLMDAGVEVTAADMPEANRFMLHVMAAVAEHEARAISDRTKAALAARKARGLPCGWAIQGRIDHATAVQAASVHRRQVADAFAMRAGPRIQSMCKHGKTLRAVAADLNEMGFPTARKGSKWHDTSVRNVLARYEAQLSVIATQAGHAS